MQAAGCAPDVISYNSALGAVAGRGKEERDRLLRGMEENKAPKSFVHQHNSHNSHIIYIINHRDYSMHSTQYKHGCTHLHHCRPTIVTCMSHVMHFIRLRRGGA